MRPKSPMWLEDIVRAADAISRYTDGKTLADYEQDDMLRDAVERRFQIIGEVLLSLEQDDPETAGRITGYRQVIGFRNRLAHGYDEEIDNAKVWAIVQSALPTLHEETQALLAEAE